MSEARPGSLLRWTVAWLLAAAAMTLGRPARPSSEEQIEKFSPAAADN
jgi:hypothetical protein